MLGYLLAAVAIATNGATNDNVNILRHRTPNVGNRQRNANGELIEDSGVVREGDERMSRISGNYIEETGDGGVLQQ